MKVEVTKDELGIINNALNEVCNGIDLEGEFDTRMGCTVELSPDLKSQAARESSFCSFACSA